LLNEFELFKNESEFFNENDLEELKALIGKPVLIIFLDNNKDIDYITSRMSRERVITWIELLKFKIFYNLYGI
jgi:hypothetical protein